MWYMREKQEDSEWTVMTSNGEIREDFMKEKVFKLNIVGRLSQWIPQIGDACSHPICADLYGESCTEYSML